MKENQFYCVSCRKKVMVHKDDIGVNMDKRKKPRLKALCCKCDTKVFKYIPECKKQKLECKYGKKR